MAQPGLTVQLSPNSRELLKSECATSENGDTSLPSLALTHQRAHGVFMAGNRGSSGPSAPPTTGNTEGRVSPSLRSSSWELQEHRTHDSNVDKKAAKGSASNP